MATGYVRQAAGNIAAGLPIQSADVNAEFNTLQSAFDSATGHDHSGSVAGDGAKIVLTTSVSGALPYANGGTNNTASYTLGSVVFADGTKLTQDNTTLFWDNTNKVLSIGSNAGTSSFRTYIKGQGATSGTFGLVVVDSLDSNLLYVRDDGVIAIPKYSSGALSVTGGGILSSSTLSIANGGTNNTSAYTLGSIVYSDGTKLTQDNSNFFWDSTNKRLGINNTSPSGSLHIGSTSSTFDSKILLASGNGAGISRIWSISSPYGGASTTDPFYGFLIKDETGGSSRFFISLNTGFVGIGTTAPAFKLDVNGSLNASNQGSQLGTASGSFSGPTTGNTNILLYNTSASNWAGIGADTSGDIYFVNGTASPSTKLLINPAGVLRINSYGAGTLSTDANGVISASSDEKLKNISGKFTKGLSDLLKIDPIVYRWKPDSGLDTENDYVGFSAQNVQSVIPEAVGENKDGSLTLSDRTLLAAVVKAIQELNDKIENK